VNDVISEVVLGPFWLTLPGPGRKLLDGGISLKFSLQTRLKSESWPEKNRWPKSPPLMTSLTKKPAPPNQKSFFQVQTTGLAESFELFTGSVALTGPEKFPRKAMCVLVGFFLKSQKAAGRQSVERVMTYIYAVSNFEGWKCMRIR